MKKLLSCLILAALLLSGCAAKTDGKLVIGIISWVTHPALDASVEGFKSAVVAEYGADAVTFIEKNAESDQSTADLAVKDFVSRKVNLIYAVATPSAQAAINAIGTASIPLVFAAVTDPVAAELVDKTSGQSENVTGVSDAAPIEKQLKLIQEILPNVKRIGMMYTLSEINGKIQVEQAKTIAASLGIEVVDAGVSTDSEVVTVAGQLVQKVDCIYNITDNMIVANTATIVDQANKVKIPVFAAEDGQLDQGLLATDSLSYVDMGTEAGNLAISILKDGKSAQSLPVVFSQATKLYVNSKVAASLGLTLPESVLSRAQLVD